MWSLKQISFATVSLGNIGFLIFLVHFIYHRIEIQHPIYAVLFCDLCFTLGLALLDFLALLANDLELFFRISGTSVVFSLQFLSSTWLVVAVLR